MEQNTTNGTIGILTLTWLIIKFGIACVLAILIMSCVVWFINWTITTIKGKNTDNIWNNIKNKLTSKKDNLSK